MTARDILVVDDEPAIRQMLAYVLQRAGYVVRQAANSCRDSPRLVADGMTSREILRELPDLQREDIEEALRFAVDALRRQHLPLITAV